MATMATQTSHPLQLHVTSPKVGLGIVGTPPIGKSLRPPGWAPTPYTVAVLPSCASTRHETHAQPDNSTFPNRGASATKASKKARRIDIDRDRPLDQRPKGLDSSQDTRQYQKGQQASLTHTHNGSGENHHARGETQGPHDRSHNMPKGHQARGVRVLKLSFLVRARLTLVLRDRGTVALDGNPTILPLCCAVPFSLGAYNSRRSKKKWVARRASSSL
eukprot:scaffold119955_cov35-Tisochrysis_lutea.AAC.5